MEEKKRRGGILGCAALMSIIVLFSKALGLLRDVLVANFFGTGVEATAYDVASSLPITIFDLVIGGVVSSAFIPVFNSTMVKKGKKEAFSFASSYINFIVAVCSLIAVAGLLFAPALVRLQAPQASAEVASLAETLTRIMFPMIIFTGLAFSFVGILQSLGEFNIPALISLVSNAIMVGYLFSLKVTDLSTRTAVIGLAAAMLAGWAAQAFIQIPKMRSLGFEYKLRSPVVSPPLLKAAKSAAPILIGTWTTPLCTLINKRAASGIEGGITALGYSNRLYIVIVGVFSFVATNLLFPYFSRAEAEGDREGAQKMIRASVKTLVYIIAPIAVGLICLSVPFTSLVYERGEFVHSDTILTASALSRYAVGMVFMAANEVLVKALFAAEKPARAMISSLSALGVNLVVVTVFGEKLGVGGIALVSALATAVNLFINLIMARSAGVCRFTVLDGIDVVRSLLSAAVMIPVILFISSKFNSNIATLALSVVASAIVYFAASFALRSEEAKALLSIITKKRNSADCSEDK